jgi:hypothetical protein
MEVMAFIERTVYRAEANRLLRGGGPTAKSRLFTSRAPDYCQQWQQMAR